LQRLPTTFVINQSSDLIVAFSSNSRTDSIATNCVD